MKKIISGILVLAIVILGIIIIKNSDYLTAKVRFQTISETTVISEGQTVFVPGGYSLDTSNGIAYISVIDNNGGVGFKEQITSIYLLSEILITVTEGVVIASPS